MAISPKKLTIGILAHVDSGKTTLSEAILFACGAIRSIGRVDHGDTFLDNNAVERDRGITVFSKQAEASWDGVDAVLIDTPGHVDFSAEMERTLSILDIAVLVIGASDGIKSHTETLRILLERHGIPTFVFVNKMDIAVRKQSEILAAIRSGFSAKVLDFTSAVPSEDDLTLVSETIAEAVLDGASVTDELISDAVLSGEIWPCVFGSALNNKGVSRLMTVISRFAPDPEYGVEHSDDMGPYDIPSGLIFKISRGSRGERLTFLKLTGGTVFVKDTVTGTHSDGSEFTSKIDEIRIYSGMRYRSVKSAGAGDVIAVTGLEDVLPGDALGYESPVGEGVLEPVMSYRVLPTEDIDPKRLIRDMNILTEEDPKLAASWDPEKGQVTVRLMGDVQTEILSRIINERFGYSVSFGAPELLYMETIASVVEGVGHFEPLRHYAEVHLVLEPLERGSGIVLTSEVPEDILDRNWQNLILSHLTERVPRGVLTGAPITDIKIILAAGRAHKKHTEGGDFREATWRALRNGLMKARSVLLEPWFSFTADVPQEMVGRLMSDVRACGGEFGAPESVGAGGAGGSVGSGAGSAGGGGFVGGLTRLTGFGPASGLMGYSSVLTSYTGGRGSISLRNAGYRECADPSAVIAASGYDPERDLAFPADSVFCTHGASDIVKWDHVEEYMHIPYVLTDRGAPAIVDTYQNELRRRASVRVAAGEDELKAIFERTYGPVKRDPLTAPGRNLRNKIGRMKRGENEYMARKARAAARRAAAQAAEARKPAVPARVFVDGYNLINAWPELLELSRKDFGSARDALVDRLCNYGGATGAQVTAVFDAYKVPGGQGSHERIRNIDVVYTPENVTADAYIERVTKRLEKSSAGGSGRSPEIRVVSSDALVQQISLGHGALRVSAREFIEEIEALEAEIRGKLGK